MEKILMLFMSVLVLIFTSCEKDEPVLLNYNVDDLINTEWHVSNIIDTIDNNNTIDNDTILNDIVLSISSTIDSVACFKYNDNIIFKEVTINNNSIYVYDYDKPTINIDSIFNGDYKEDFKNIKWTEIILCRNDTLIVFDKLSDNTIITFTH